MNNLVYLKNDEPVCSSLQVAEKFGKRHDNVMQSIRGLLKNEGKDSTMHGAQTEEQQRSVMGLLETLEVGKIGTCSNIRKF